MMRILVVAAVFAVFVGSCSRDGPSAEGRDALRLDAGSPLDRSFTLKDAAPLDVDALLALVPQRLRPTYEKASFDRRLGATIMIGVGFPDPDGDGPRLPMTIKRLELYGVDREAMRRINDAKRDNSAPFETVFVKVRAFDVVPERNVDDAAAIGAVEWSGMRVRRGAFAPLEGLRPTAAHFLNNFELGGLYFKGWSVGGGSDKQDDFSFKAPDLRFGGLSGGKLKGVVAKGVEYQVSMSPGMRAAFGGGFGPVIGALLNGPFGAFLFPADQRVTVGSFEWRDIDLAGWMQKELAGEEIAMDARGLISLGTMRARKIDTLVRGKLASRAEENAVTMTEFVGVVPSEVTAASKGAVLDFTAYVEESDKGALDILKKRKLDKAPASSRFTWTWDAEKGLAVLRSDFKADRFADMKFSLEMADVEAAKMEAARKAGGRADFVSFGSLKGLSFRIDDDAMLDTMFALSAEQSGQMPEVVRKEMPEGMRLLAKTAEGVDSRYVQILGAAANFLEQGGTLEITAAPEAPVAFADLGAGGPAALARTVNLSARHDPPKSKR